MAKTKKDIDKELMYKMLMPSGPKTVRTTLQDVVPEVSENTDLPEEHPPVESPLNQHRALMRREVGVPSMDTQSTVLVNAMESIVLEKLETALTRFQCCKCDRCKKDIVAMALNKLPPKYMVLLEGQPTPDISAQANAEVVTAIIKAILAVRAHPRH